MTAHPPPTPLAEAQRTLWQPGGLDETAMQQVLGQLQGASIDYADLYFQESRREAWQMEEGLVKSGSFNLAQGVGIRAVSGEKTGFAYCDDLCLPALVDAAHQARSIAKHGGDAKPLAIRSNPAPALYEPHNPPDSLADEAKVDLLRRTEAAARAADARVIQVQVGLHGVRDTLLVVRSDGHLAGDVRPLVRLGVQVIVEQNGRREQAYFGGGGRMDYAAFGNEQAEKYAREAVRQALVNLEARDAPAGEMPVVLGPGWPGILLHEAVGHGLEGDFNRKGTSAFSGRIGEQVATKLCTVVDDATLPGRRGSLSVDDEGEPGQSTVLIEDGVLVGYMHDQLSARLMNMPPTGNGRRESYAHLPMPRMTNTYMLAGPHAPEEILKSVKRGLYAVNFGGGQVDITSGKFVFTTAEAYMIENGRVTHPVKNATLIGDGPSALTEVSMLGTDMQLDSGVGVCGKEGQSVPVGVGQATMRVDKLTVGGAGA